MVHAFPTTYPFSTSVTPNVPCGAIIPSQANLPLGLAVPRARRVCGKSYVEVDIGLMMIAERWLGGTLATLCCHHMIIACAADGKLGATVLETYSNPFRMRLRTLRGTGAHQQATAPKNR